MTRPRQTNNPHNIRQRVRQTPDAFEMLFVLSTEDGEPLLTEDGDYLEEYSPDATTPADNQP